MTTKQKIFCEAYITCPNATQAAITAGYSVKTAKAIGCENLTKPNLREFIDSELDKKSLKASETVKLISDIARGSLNDYFVIKQVEHTPRVKKGLGELISEIKEEISFEDEYASLANYTEKQYDEHYERQNDREKRILRFSLELKRNPKASRIVDGETIFIDKAVLDMVKLVADKELGKIKSISPTPSGMKVEMYPADNALKEIARMHGLYEKDNDQSKPVFTPPVINIIAPNHIPDERRDNG